MIFCAYGVTVSQAKPHCWCAYNHQRTEQAKFPELTPLPTVNHAFSVNRWLLAAMTARESHPLGAAQGLRQRGDGPVSGMPTMRRTCNYQHYAMLKTLRSLQSLCRLHHRTHGRQSVLQMDLSQDSQGGGARVVSNLHGCNSSCRGPKSLDSGLVGYVAPAIR